MTEKEAYELLVREFAKFKVGDRVTSRMLSGLWEVASIHFDFSATSQSVEYRLFKVREDGTVYETWSNRHLQKWLTAAEETTPSQPCGDEQALAKRDRQP